MIKSIVNFGIKITLYLMGVFGGLVLIFELLQELGSRNNEVLKVVVLALVLFGIHVILRRANPKKYVALEGNIVKSKFSEFILDYVFSFLIALSLATVTLTLLMGDELRVLSQAQGVLNYGISKYLLLVVGLLLFAQFIYVAANFLSTKLFGWKRDSVKASNFHYKLLNGVIVVIVISVFLAANRGHEDLILALFSWLLFNSQLEQLSLFLLGIPAVFWFSYLFVGVKIIKSN